MHTYDISEINRSTTSSNWVDNSDFSGIASHTVKEQNEILADHVGKSLLASHFGQYIYF